MFITALFIVAQMWKQSKCPATDEGTEMWYIYTMAYYSAIKKKEIMSCAATWMDSEGIMPSEISQRKTNTI